MKEMNLRAIYPGPNTSKRTIGSKVYKYLLSDVSIIRQNQVWQVDITYLRTFYGFVYLVAFIDVYSRVVVGWSLSNNLSTESCLLALQDAIINYGLPEIINSDQGSQFTSDDWIKFLQSNHIKISMTGKGRCNDNANIERWYQKTRQSNKDKF